MRPHFVYPESPGFQAAHFMRSNDAYHWNRQIDEHLPGGRVRCGDRTLLMLGGNSYLGLIQNAELRRSAAAALERFGLGTYGTRPMSGTTALHAELEALLSETNGSEASVLFPSGFQANLSTIAALVGQGDIVIGDQLNHASIIDGCRLSRAQVAFFRHNDMDDLRKKLEDARSFRNRLIVVDGVFSMDGDIAPLPQLCQLRDDHKAVLMVDEAHSLGVLGAGGRGVVEHFGLGRGDIDVISGVLSKAIPGTGGYVSGSAELIDYLRHTARSYIFSGALAPFNVAVIIAALRHFIGNKPLIERLWSNTRVFHDELKRLGVPIGGTATPITPILISENDRCAAAAQYCMEHGVFVVAIPYPVVPRGMTRLRSTVTAEHEPADLIAAATIIAQAAAQGAPAPRARAG
jgi:glycine C-acetyltransferase